MTEWFQRCETDSGGRDSFVWRFTFDTSFRAFREAAAGDRTFTLHLTDLSNPEFIYLITAGELSDGLRNHKLKVIVPAAQGFAERRDALKQEHPKWEIELVSQTRGSNTPFVQIPVEAVHKRRRPPVEELQI